MGWNKVLLLFLPGNSNIRLDEMVTKDIKMGQQRHGILLKMRNNHNLFEIQTRDMCTS